MCEFQSGTIECRGDGYLWDADHDGYDPNEFDNPCPQCNTEAFLEKRKDEAESCSYASGPGYSVTGAEIWDGAVKSAKALNPDTDEILKKISCVNALVDDPSAEDGFRVKTFTY